MRHFELDFSGDICQLETLEGDKNNNEVIGLIHEDLAVRYLRSLNISDNILVSIDCVTASPKIFPELKQLVARHNHLSTVNLCLYNLTVLDLSDNIFEDLPKFDNMPNLEVVCFANNEIENLSCHEFDVTKKLRHLDLSGNIIDMIPSQMEVFLDSLSKTNLQALKLNNNPFCKYFKEHSLFAVSYISTLNKMDGLQVNDDVRDHISSLNLREMRVYDDVVEDRKASDTKPITRPDTIMMPHIGKTFFYNTYLKTKFYIFYHSI